MNAGPRINVNSTVNATGLSVLTETLSAGIFSEALTSQTEGPLKTRTVCKQTLPIRKILIKLYDPTGSRYLKTALILPTDPVSTSPAVNVTVSFGRTAGTLSSLE